MAVAIQQYTTVVSTSYGSAPPGTACTAPTEEEEAKALSKALAEFQSMAQRYCNEGRRDTDPAVAAEVTILSVVREEPIEGDYGSTPCMLKFRITAALSCKRDGSYTFDKKSQQSTS